MYEVWYVSCHGFGHITRYIAQIERKFKSAQQEKITIKNFKETVAECICNKTRMVLLKRDGVLEDTHIINELKKYQKQNL